MTSQNYISTNFSRHLFGDERYYATSPISMAGHHYREAGESRNPYKKDSMDYKAYENYFHYLNQSEMQSL